MLEQDDKLEWEAKRLALLQCWSKKEGQMWQRRQKTDGEYERDSGDRINRI